MLSVCNSEPNNEQREITDEKGAQRVGMIGRSSSQNVYETRDFHEEPNNGGYELGPMNQRHAEKDAPPAYDDAVRK